ncbi:MAG: glucokinase [Pseudomonadales bacterium]
MTIALVADIGATHARFALTGADGAPGDPVVLPTPDSPGAEALIRAALARLGAEPGTACLAIAGPVRDGRGSITNGTLTFDAAALGATLGMAVTLVNDFQALAMALPHLRSLRSLGGPPAGAGTKAVLGPGSGLGMGVLVPVGDRWQVLASEGGHADLAPGSPLELELLGVLQAEHGHVCWETVLCGPGLVRLYRAVCAVWGSTPAALGAADVTRLGVDADDPVCHQTLEVFCSLLGSAAGNLAVTVCAHGGVYLGGGILPQLADFVAASPLRRRFEERGAMTALVREMPLLLILDPAPGLTGAAALLHGSR